MALRDEKYAQFSSKLVPNLDPQRVIGVRTPALRGLAKELKGTPLAETFLQQLPHHYLEENTLHGFLISETKDYGRLINQLDAFLPHVDNWATCDQMRPKLFAKRQYRHQVEADALRWMHDGHTYTIRFGVEMLMTHFLDEDFNASHLEEVAMVRQEDYYVRMMQAWYMATALAKQWEATLPVLKNQRMEVWVHNKTIQKAIESYRITAEQKELLRTLKRR